MTTAAEIAPDVDAPEFEKGRKITWYRTPIDKKLLKELSQRSDWKGLQQFGGFYGLYFGTLAAAVYTLHVGYWPLTILFVYLHGMVSGFQGGCAMHELIHNTVFKTKWLNTWATRFVSLNCLGVGVCSHVWFQTSHQRHHAYTLHPPDDLEVTLPSQMPKSTFWNWFTICFFNPKAPYWTVKGVYQWATGKIEGEWNNKMFPVGDPKRQELINWTRYKIAYHVAILIVASVLAWVLKMPALLLIPFMISFGGMFGSWLGFLLGMPQHYGLRDNVADFRKSCRTYTTNPLFRLLYWQMNYHIDHHMFPTVPCYNLTRLHAAIKHDLPRTPKGVWACWKDMLEINKRLRADPKYMHDVEVPGQPTATAAKA